MMTTTRTPGTFLLLAILIASGCGDGGEQDRTPVLVPGGGDAITVWTEKVELFFEYPPLVAGVPGEPWAIHLTNLADFQPVADGVLTLRFEGFDGELLVDTAEAPARPGIYTNAPSFSSPGMYDLVMEVKGQELEEEIYIGPVQVFASAEDLPLLPEAESVGISFLKEQQWPIEFAVVSARARAVPAGVTTTGEVLAPPNGLAEVTAPVEGIIRWDENRTAPSEGTWVDQGDPMARLSPVGGSNAYAELVGRAELLQREVSRTERLAAAEAIPARRLEEARLELDIVQAQLAALDAQASEGYTLTLRSPLTGIVTNRTVTIGQRVAGGDPLFTVFDPRRVWIRFHVPPGFSGQLEGIKAATFSPEGSDQVFKTTRLKGVAPTLDPLRRTVGVTFEMPNTDGILRPGMLVQGRVLLSDPDPTLAVPSEAITDENGIKVAYVQIGGETFERRAVSVGDTDGQWTTILSGIRSGEYVVTRGAYQIRLSSLNTSEISDHGHVH